LSNKVTAQQATIQAHAAATDPTLFVLTYAPDGGGWQAHPYDAVTGVALTSFGHPYPLVSMPAAFGTKLFEINGNFTIGKYNLSDGSLIKADFIRIPAERGTAWSVVTGSLTTNRLFVGTDLGIVEEYNATTGALINPDLFTRANSAEPPYGIQWPATPSTAIFSPAPNGTSGAYGPLLASGNYLYVGTGSGGWKAYDIVARIVVGTGFGNPLYGSAFTVLGNYAYEMSEGGGVVQLFAANGQRVANSIRVTFTPPAGTTPSPMQCGIAASGNYLFIANGNPGTVSQYTPDGVLVNPNFIVTGSDFPIAALFVAPGF
jgi:hypothetical protein